MDKGYTTKTDVALNESLHFFSKSIKRIKDETVLLTERMAAEVDYSG